jgi:voltage-gated potassium channel
MKKRNADLLTALLVLLILIAFGVWYFQFEEGWTWVDSFYFTVMTITSVGYGDLVPTHDISKIITSFYSLISIPLVIFALGIIAKSYFEERIMRIERRMTEMLTREKVLEEDVEEAMDNKITTNR